MRTPQRFLIIAALMPCLASAQTAEPFTPKNVISLQPLSALLLVAAGEYERAISKVASIGVGGSHWSPHNSFDRADTYTNGDLKLRYYPAGDALHGFSLGGSVGSANFSRDSAGTTRSATGASFGVSFEYQSLLGQKKNFAVAVGLGAKALTIDTGNKSSTSSNERYPTLRVSVGLAY